MCVAGHRDVQYEGSTRRSGRAWSVRRTRVFAALLAAGSLAAGCGGSSSNDATSPVSVPDSSVDAGSTTTEAGSETTSTVKDVLSLDDLSGTVTMQGIGCGNGFDPADAAGLMEGVDSVDEALAALGQVMNLDPVMQICIMNPDGSDLKAVTPLDQEAEYPGWTWDGSMLFFFTEGRWNVADPDGSNVRPWTDPTDLPWRRSPDGTMYVNLTVHDLGFFVTRVGEERRGPSRRLMTDDPEHCCSTFRWSPDSKSLLFYKGLDDCSTLWKIDVATLEQTPLTGPGSPSADVPICVEFDSALWSPDGSTIMVTDFEGLSDDYRTYLMDADGSNIRPLFADGTFDDPAYMVGAAAWSPDGRYVMADIVFSSKPGGLFVTSVADGSILAVPAPFLGALVYLAWAPEAPTLQPLPDQDIDAV